MMSGKAAKRAAKRGQSRSIGSRLIDADQVLIVVITRGAVRVETIGALEAVRQANPTLPPPAYVATRMSVFKARNDAVNLFLSSGREVLIMLDDDILVPSNILDLMAHLDRYSIVGAVAPIVDPLVSLIPFPDVHIWDKERGLVPAPTLWSERGLVEAAAFGFGCVAMHRRVFDAMTFPWFREEYLETLAESDSRPVLVAGEDLNFCWQAQIAGLRVAVDFDLICDHIRQVSLLDFVEAASVAGDEERTRALFERRNQDVVAGQD